MRKTYALLLLVLAAVPLAVLADPGTISAADAAQAGSAMSSAFVTPSAAANNAPVFQSFANNLQPSQFNAGINGQQIVAAQQPSTSPMDLLNQFSQVDSGTGLFVTNFSQASNTFSFQCDLSQGDFHPIQYTWTFGDGSQAVNTAANNVAHAFSNVGQFQTTCTATDGIQTKTAAVSVNVAQQSAFQSPYAFYYGAAGAPSHAVAFGTNAITGILNSVNGALAAPGFAPLGAGYGIPGAGYGVPGAGYGVPGYGGPGYAGAVGVPPATPAYAAAAPAPVATAPAAAAAAAGPAPGVPAPAPLVGPMSLPPLAAAAPPDLLAGPLSYGVGGFGNAIYPYSYLGIPFAQQQTNVTHDAFQSVTTPAFQAFSNGVNAGYNFVPYTTSQSTHQQASNNEAVNGGFYQFANQQQTQNTVSDNFNHVTQAQIAQNSGSGFLDCPGLAIDLGGTLGSGVTPNACRVFINAPAVGGRQFTGVINFVQGSGVNAPVVTGSFPVLGNAFNPLLNALNVNGFNVVGTQPIPGGNVVQWSTQGNVNTVVPQLQNVMAAANIGAVPPPR